MKEIIMQCTIPLICKSREDYEKLLTEGFVLKEHKDLKYLIKIHEG